MIIQLVLLQIVTFGALILAMRYFYNKHLNAALTRLRELQEEAFVKESHLREELDRARRERESQVEKGKQQAREIVDKTRQETEAMRQQMVTEAQQQRDRIIKKGEQENQKLYDTLMADLENRAADLAVRMITSIFEDKEWQALEGHLMTFLIDELEKVDPGRFPSGLYGVELISSAPLSEHDRHRLKNILSEKLSNAVSLQGAVEFQEHVDSGLISGFVVRIGDFIIDASLKNRLQKYRAQMKEN